MRLDYKTTFPSGMEDYLELNGWHFNKKMCEWAVSKMYREDINGKKQAIIPYTKDQLDQLLKKYNIILTNDIGYDAVYIINMAKSDFFGFSIIDEGKLVKYVKDYLDDADGYQDIAFTRFYADCIGKGLIISWEDML